MIYIDFEICVTPQKLPGGGGFTLCSFFYLICTISSKLRGQMDLATTGGSFCKRMSEEYVVQGVLQCVLQCVAVCCSALQCVADVKRDRVDAAVL